MSEAQPIGPGEPARVLGYALNAFPYHTLAELWSCLETDVLALKARAFPDTVFPVELRFSEPLVRELASDCNEVSKLKHFLDVHDLALVTVNAFVLPRFHGEPVKERVYLPAWHESDTRARFTCDSLDLLAQLAPVSPNSVRWERRPRREGEGDTAGPVAAWTPLPPAGNEPLLSVSVPFGALKPVAMDQTAPPILRCAEYARRLHERTGTRVVVALEPEPGLTVETTKEVVEFFSTYVPQELRPYLGVNFDLSHQLVEFEDLGESVAQLQRQDILVAKVHVANAAELPAPLRPFDRDSIYLHQVCGVNAQGERAYFSLDWPATPPPAEIVKFRVHYHLPVFPTAIPSTLAEVEEFLLGHPGTQALGHSVPLIVETYTWPEQLGGREQLVDNIVRELDWVRTKISLV